MAVGLNSCSNCGQYHISSWWLWVGGSLWGSGASPTIFNAADYLMNCREQGYKAELDVETFVTNGKG